jgi:tetratricopeptide (TPR) repeat protein
MGIIYNWLGIIYMHNKKYKEAIKIFEKMNDMVPVQNWGLFWIGIIHAIEGKKDKATHFLNELLNRRTKRYVSASLIAFLYDILGSKTETYVWLERAYEERDHCLAFLKILFGSYKLRQDPSFTDFLKKMDLVER